MEAMQWFNEMLVASGCTMEHASMATAVVGVVLTYMMVRGIFVALFPKR